MLKELIEKNRTYRRFYQDVKISKETLMELVDYGRLAPTGRNMQAIKYIIVNDEQKNEMIFKHLKWAGYLPDWDGPEEGEKPSAYIIMLRDNAISKAIMWDHGIASAYVLLGAVEKGYGGATIAAFNRNEIIKALNIPEHLEPLMVLALGKPKEVVVMDELEPDGKVEYWRDENQVHHVPKRKLKDIIVEL